MNHDDFNALVFQSTERSATLLHEKSHEYAQRGKDRLTQFKFVGRGLSIEPVLVACILAAKHWDSIAQMASHHKDYGLDLWREKLDDLRNYTYFIEALITEGEEAPRE